MYKYIPFSQNIKRGEKMDKKLEKLKMEVINELGLFEKVQKNGLNSLTAKEAGRVGGIMSRRIKIQ
jgi:small acid-soluble spore protein F (minor alpha/beta-type SASP)